MRIAPLPQLASTPVAPRRPADAAPRAAEAAERARDGAGRQRGLDAELARARRLQSLRSRDREVRAHELAHQGVGGRYAGAASFETVTGPDGRRYAVGGEVAIDTAPASTPRETLRKMAIVQRAALAPAEPSLQDRQVAAEAAAEARRARAELARAREAGPRAGEYLERGRGGPEQVAGEPVALRAFRQVSAMGAGPEFLSRGGRLDLQA